MNSDQNFKHIENLRLMLEHDERIIMTESYGATSTISTKSKRRIKNVARGGITNEKYSKLLYQLCKKFEIKKALELGTSFGLSSLYLSKVKDIHVVTFEGCSETANIAKSNFNQLNAGNIKLIEGNINESLKDYLESQSEKIDFVFFDANHRYAPTIHYFELCLERSHDKSIFVFDDIHWSAEMKKSWTYIRSNPLVSISIDLFQLGIIFFDPDLSKEHFIL